MTVKEYLNQKVTGPYLRYCKTLMLKDDPELMEAYRKVHAPGAFWPEITRGMREVGIIDMEIYQDGARLFMIMDTVPDFDYDSAMDQLASKPRQAEWEAFVSRFQNSDPDQSSKDKWGLMERIYKLGE